MMRVSCMSSSSVDRSERLRGAGGARARARWPRSRGRRLGRSTGSGMSSTEETVISASPSARPVAIRVSSAVALRSAPSSPSAAWRSSLRTLSSIQAASSIAPCDRAAVHQGALQLERLLDPLAGLDPVDRVVGGDQRRGAHRQRGADRAVALEHRSQRQQEVAQAVQRALALAAHLEAADRPGEGAVGVGAGLEGAGELGQLGRLGLAEAVAAGTGRRGAGGDPPPAVARRSGRRRRGRGRRRRP